jgi:ABC-type multidrug transport system fused ATPase/permease subunit
MRGVHDPREAKLFSWGALVKALIFLLGERKKKFLFWLFWLYVINFYVVVPSLLMGQIVDFFTVHKVGASYATFYFYTVTLGVSFALVSFVRLSLKNIIGDLKSDIVYSLKVNGSERLLEFSLRWHDAENSGNKVTRVQNGLTSFMNLMRLIENEVVRAFTSILGVTVVVIFLKPVFLVFFLAYLLGFYAILKFFYGRIDAENEAYFISTEKAGGSYVEGLSNILSIKTSGASQSFKTHIAAREEVTRAYEYKIRRLYNALWKAFQGFNGLAMAVFLSFVGSEAIAGRLSVGLIIVLFGYLQSFINSAIEILSMMEDLLRGKTGIGRLMPIFEGVIEKKGGEAHFPKNWEKLSLQNVSFRYSQAELKQGEKLTNLESISFEVPKHEKVGIVGKTGSGKSTLAKLLVGLYPIDGGDYKIGETNFKEIKHQEVSEKMALVLQESEMFNLSFKENITLMRKVGAELLEKAIKVAQLTEVVAKLPDGMETLIGEKGYHLSGGERQRVGIARAICRDPEILVLDEATSSLDVKTEEELQNALEKTLSQKTLIIIAHRVSTLKNTNKIIVLEEGALIAESNYKELFG